MEKDPWYTRRKHLYVEDEPEDLGDDKQSSKNSAEILAEEPSFEERERRAEYGEEMEFSLALVKRNKMTEIIHYEHNSDGKLGPGAIFEFGGPYRLNNSRLQQLEKMGDDEKNRCYENMAALRTLGKEGWEGDSDDDFWLYYDVHNEYLGDVDVALLEKVYSSDEIDPEAIKRYKDMKKKIKYVKDCYREYKEEKETGKDDSDSVEK